MAERATATGIHRESRMGLVPTGASFGIATVWFCAIDDGRLAAIRAPTVSASCSNSAPSPTFPRTAR